MTSKNVPQPPWRQNPPCPAGLDHVWHELGTDVKTALIGLGAKGLYGPGQGLSMTTPLKVSISADVFKGQETHLVVDVAFVVETIWRGTPTQARRQPHPVPLRVGQGVEENPVT